MDENRYYTTVQGDMWDSIAYQFYGDTKYIGLLFENNQDLLAIKLVSTGTKTGKGFTGSAAPTAENLGAYSKERNFVNEDL